MTGLPRRDEVQMRHSASCDFHMGAACSCGMANDVLSKVQLVGHGDITRRNLEYAIGNMIASIVSNGPGIDISRYTAALAHAIDDRIRELKK